ncbi:MAG: glutamine synthetase family protein [Geminicoccaceae bacterium]
MPAELDAFLREHPLTGAIDILLPDLAGVLRGKRLPPDDIYKALAGEAFFTTTVYAIDTPGANVAESGLVWEQGDADRPLRLDSATLRPVPWRPGRAQILGGMSEADGTPFFADVRALVRRLADEFTARGLRPVAALEFEFYLIDAASDAFGAPQVPHSERLGRRPVETEVFAPERMDDQEAFFNLVESYAETQGLPLKGALCEFAPGQFQVNLGHVDDMVLAADHGAMLKRCVKAAARATGQRATFMAKPFAEQSGSGLHVHLSLLDRAGRNLFGETEGGERRLREAVRGLQELMPEAMLVFAPNANSYRRLRPLTYAPTAPTWGWNNRTVALRIPAGGPSARRIEHRVAGSDANSYLVLAAVLAGVLEGLERGEAAGEPAVGNAYASTEPSLPLSWEDSLAAFRGAQRLQRWFGERFCKLFAAVRQGERDRFHARITPTEYEWYLTTV